MKYIHGTGAADFRHSKSRGYQLFGTPEQDRKFSE